MEFQILKVDHLAEHFDRINSTTDPDEADTRLIIIQARCRKNREDEWQQITVLIDCGATGQFVSPQAAERLDCR